MLSVNGLGEEIVRALHRPKLYINGVSGDPDMKSVSNLRASCLAAQFRVNSTMRTLRVVLPNTRAQLREFKAQYAVIDENDNLPAYKERMANLQELVIIVEVEEETLADETLAEETLSMQMQNMSLSNRKDKDKDQGALHAEAVRILAASIAKKQGLKRGEKPLLGSIRQLKFVGSSSGGGSSSGSVPGGGGPVVPIAALCEALASLDMPSLTSLCVHITHDSIRGVDGAALDQMIEARTAKATRERIRVLTVKGSPKVNAIMSRLISAFPMTRELYTTYLIFGAPLQSLLSVLTDLESVKGIMQYDQRPPIGSLRAVQKLTSIFADAAFVRRAFPCAKTITGYSELRVSGADLTSPESVAHLAALASLPGNSIRLHCRHDCLRSPVPPALTRFLFMGVHDVTVEFGDPKAEGDPEAEARDRLLFEDAQGVAKKFASLLAYTPCVASLTIIATRGVLRETRSLLQAMSFPSASSSDASSADAPAPTIQRLKVHIHNKAMSSDVDDMFDDICQMKREGQWGLLKSVDVRGLVEEKLVGFSSYSKSTVLGR